MPLNRVSFYGKNCATGCPFVTKIIRQGIKIDKNIMRQGIMLKEISTVLLKQRIMYLFDKILCDRVYFRRIFYAIGYGV